MEANQKYLTVGALTRYLKMRFDTDENLRLVFLKGEISNFKSHSTGHLYFSIKDETSKINAIMFNRSASKLLFTPTDGTKVLVMGRVSVYEATGNYQIYVEDMIEDGVGNLYIAFEKLKEQLSKEGLFNPEHKKKLPKIPLTVGIITAPTGAAVKDIISTVRRRFPLARTILFPSLVQGENAATDLVRNIQRAEEYDLDVLIIGRGGGSIEDLWPFNEEIVARAIYHSRFPTISAVGHEIDYTISDFVADFRAPTPTGAAEIAVPHIQDLIKHINQLKIRLNESMRQTLNLSKTKFERFKNSYILNNPMALYDMQVQRFDIDKDNLEKAMEYLLEQKRQALFFCMQSVILKHPEELYKTKRIHLEHKIASLELLNPLSVLKRGYAIPYQEENVVKSVRDFKKEAFTLRMSDGEILADVIEIKENT